MPHVCPRPCSRLATAAVFISVGVVQIVAGIILLRSKYVYLLSGPDIWTACSNIAVGCLLGVSASVWKHSKKRPSMKHMVRRNILLSLIFSALVINSTTLGILLLGEGHTMLSIQMEGDSVYSTITFKREVLAYAYATSVCSPIICIVVSIVAMSGSCFAQSPKKNYMDMETPRNSLKRKRSQSFQWVYTPQILALPKKSRQVVLTSSSDSSSDEDSEELPTPQAYSNTVEDMQRVLHRMAEGKRDRILNDSTVMLEQLNLRRKNRYNSLIQDGSYVGPLLSRSREIALSERKCPRDDSVKYEEYSQSINPRIYRNSVTYDGNSTRVSYGDITLERILSSRKHPQNVLQRDQYNTDEEISNYQNLSSQLAAKNFHAHYRNFEDNLQTGSEIDGVKLSRSSQDGRPKYVDTAGVHKPPARLVSMEGNRNDLSSEYHSFKAKPELPPEISEENSKFSDASKCVETVSPATNNCFSPGGSYIGADSSDLSRTSSWAGEIVPINTSNLIAARLSQKLTPVPSPIAPEELEVNRSKQSPVATQSTSNANQNAAEEERSLLTSFRENSKPRNKETVEEYPKVGQPNAKKYDLARVVTMTSISEEPNTDIDQPTQDATRSALCKEIAEVSMMRANYLNKSLSTAYPESRDHDQDRDNLERDFTPKRKTRASCKSLRKLWSTSSAKELDIRNHVVDEDSLIGLSEDELIARQNRIRSIRKAVQQRIKVREMVI